MDLFTYLMAKNDHNSSVNKDLFSYLLGKGQSGTYATFTGTSINANNTRRGKMKLSLYGNTSQTGTPTPSSPQQIHEVSGDNEIIVCGKNICTNVTKPANAMLDFNCNKSLQQTFTISFTLTEALSNNSLYLEIVKNDIKSEYSLDRLTGDANTKIIKTITLTQENYDAIQDGDSVFFRLYKSGANFEIPTDAMIENNNEATSYEPYNGDTYELSLGDLKMRGIGTYEDYFVRNSGKNLINSVETHNGISGSGVIGTDNTYLGITDYVSCKPSTTYTITFEHDKPNSSLYLGYKDENGTFINRTYQSGRTFTTPNNAYQLFAYVYDGNGFTIGGYVMLNEGTVALPYEPYGTGQWCKYNAIGNVVLDNNNVNSIIGSYNSSSFSSPCAYASKVALGWKVAWQPTEMCLMNKYHQITSTQQVANGTFTTNFSQYDIYIFNDDFTDLSTARNLLIGTEIDIALASPYLSLIEDETLISQLDAIEKALSKDGQTNINQTNNDLPFELEAEIKVKN